MSDRWVPARREAFVRDFVRDYCQVFLILAEQARRFEHDGSMSYSGLRELMGEAMRKGVFWRLKDTAHHLFRASPDAGETGTLPADWRFAASPHPSGDARQRPVEALLDWCVGYAFHECAKLKEDAFQRQHYGNRLMQQLAKFVPVYVACGGTAEKALDLLVSRKVLRRLEGRFGEDLRENLEKLEKLVLGLYSRKDFSETLEVITKLKRKAY